jgi:glucose/arabinose dehydrogenase
MDSPRTRRSLLAAVGAAGVALAGCTGQSSPGARDGGDSGSGPDSGSVGTGTSPRPDGTASPTDDVLDGLPAGVGTELVVEGLTAPLDYAAPPGTDRRFVTDQPGVLYEVVDGRPEEYLDLRDRVVDVREGYDERGLLGVAFHPSFADTGRLVVRYSAPRRPGTPRGYSHTFVLAEFEADPSADRVDPDSERTLLEVPQPQANHNAGAVTFGPDGLLYVGVGDGGGANDVGNGHVDDWYGANRGGNGQDVTENLLGSVLRIDVGERGSGGGDRPYGIPDDNPLVGRSGLDEQWAWGFRNPWRFSFHGSDLLVADVGQNQFEEVDRVVAGGNYGWNVREGRACFSPQSPGSPPDDCPATGPDGEPLREPVVAYPHGGAEVSGIAVVGGYVSDSTGLAGLDGRYVFADWRADGRLFVAAPTGGRWPVTTVPFADDAGLGQYLLSFGREPDGSLLACTSRRQGPGGTTGTVHRLVPP